MGTAWRKLRSELEMNCQNIYEGNVLLAVSGGVDSIFLLDFMSRCKLNFDVVHFQHGIRDTDGDEVGLILNMVIDLNNKRRAKRHQTGSGPGTNHIRVYIGYGEGLKDVPNQEHEAYTQRWNFIQKTIGELQRVYTQTEDFKDYVEECGEYCAHQSVPSYLVVTAHHLNDQIESTLMNLMHGKPHDQLSMKQLNYFPNMTKYKPMLEISKSEIIERATKRSLEWIEDSTNADNKNERNWMRNVIIPQLEMRRNLTQSMAKAMAKAQQ